MAGPNAVLKVWHPMAGIDMHIPWPPGSPAPAPAPVPYRTTAIMMGMIPGLTSRFVPTVYTDGHAWAMVRGTDIGPMIPHVGPPSVTLTIEMLTSGSKSHFGAASIKVKDQFGAPGNLACALLGLVNPNLNCGTPMPTLTGFVFAPLTSMETLTLGDEAAGLYLVVFDIAAQTLLNAFGNWLGNTLSKAAEKIASKLGVNLLTRTAARQAARAAGTRANIGPAARALRAAAAARLAKIGDRASKVAIPIGLALGSPLGPSVSNVRDLDGNQVAPSGYDRVTGDGAANVEGNADQFGRDAEKANQAVANYFNSPAAHEVPAPAPPAEPADAGIPGGAPESPVGPDASAAGAGSDAASGDGAAGAPDASAAPEAPSTSTVPEAPSASTAPDAPNASTSPNASTAPDAPNASTPDGNGAPTGSDGTPDAPFSSSNGGGGPGSGE